MLYRGLLTKAVASEVRTIRTGGSTTLLTVIVVIAVLYFARMVFIPIALSILITFLLAPLVIRFRRWGLGRIPAAALVLILAFAFVSVVAGVMTTQLAQLGYSLPSYESNIRQKLQTIRNSQVVSRFTRVVRDVNTELTPAKPPPTEASAPEEKPLPVEIKEDTVAPFTIFQTLLGSIINISVMGTIVVVFVIFMLIQREDLRDRLIRLAGETRVNVTTQVLDDAARRVSRFLVAQFALNVAFGVCAAVGLYFIGIPNPVLWGMLAAVLRYVPYVGIWIAAILPVAVAFAVEPGWVKVPTIFALYFGIDLLVINFIEPLLYGSSTGVSPIAVLVAAVFWTWLWGPMGLLLATPLTVCVVVLGRYAPSLHFLSVLLSDERVLSPETRFYQRMLAMDLDEATEVAEEYLKGRSLEQLFDKVIIPALRLAEEERHRGMLDEARQKFLFQSTGLLIDDIAERADELLIEKAPGKPGKPHRKGPVGQANGSLAVLCLPARDEADTLAARMLAVLLSRRGVSARHCTSGLASEAVDTVEREGVRIVCVTAVPPFGYMHARYLCRRLQDRFEQVKLIGAILTQADVEEIRQRQPVLPVHETATSLDQAVAQVLSFIPVTEHERSLEAA